jgi:hypothetical protein
VINVSGWNSTYCPVNPLLQVAFAFALVIQFNYKPVSFTKADIVDGDEFSPPICCRWMCEQLVVNVSQELVINVPIEFANAHLVLPSGHKIAM